MRRNSFEIDEKISIGLCSFLKRGERRSAYRASVRALSTLSPASEEDSETASVLIEVEDASQVCKDLENARVLGEGFLSAQLDAQSLKTLAADRRVSRIQSAKRAQPLLDKACADIGVLAAPPGVGRAVAEDGKGVIIGIVDSGFDLSHPMFYGPAGNLRVDGLLDQTNDRVYTGRRLEKDWGEGRRRGFDADGHGTHVATIAGGSRSGSFEGVAPGVRFLLVKTDFTRTAEAVKWVFDKAGRRPCVVNLSLGYHEGAHDGTDVEERLHAALSGPGRIIVAAAGNEAEDNLHVGGRFSAGQSAEVAFDLRRQANGPPFVILTLWHAAGDAFSFSLTTPGGVTLRVPGVGAPAERHFSARREVELASRRYVWSDAVQTRIRIEFLGQTPPPERELRDWRLLLSCTSASVGRLDGWFHNSGFASFRPHPLVEVGRTIGLPATGAACLAVGSYISKSQWSADIGRMRDDRAVVGRASGFSSRGPTRDGREKPEICAPGQYLTAALAAGSEMEAHDERAASQERLLTIEGTSMACPMVAGVVALLLQKNPQLTVAQAREILRRSARRDAHTGAAAWHPAYGFGKINAAAALHLTSPSPP